MNRGLPGRGSWNPVSVLGEILLTVGLLLLLFAFWEVCWTNFQSGREQAHATDRLLDEWSDMRNPRPLVDPTSGTAFARLFIPSFGSDFSFSIVKGVGDDDLNIGPGHYTDTQEPGEKGNFAIAGHRVGRGAPFNDLGRLGTCDSIVVETAGKWLVYRVLPVGVPKDQRARALAECMDTELAQKMSIGDYAQVDGRLVTIPTDVDVLNPRPNVVRTEVRDDDEKMLTMTTCHPQFSNAERMIIHAVQVREDSKRPGFLPVELTDVA